MPETVLPRPRGPPPPTRPLSPLPASGHRYIWTIYGQEEIVNAARVEITVYIPGQSFTCCPKVNPRHAVCSTSWPRGGSRCTIHKPMYGREPPQGSRQGSPPPGR